MPQLSGKENSTGVMSGDASGGGGAGAQLKPPEWKGERLQKREGPSGQLGEPPGQARAWPRDGVREWAGLSRGCVAEGAGAAGRGSVTGPRPLQLPPRCRPGTGLCWL